MLDTIFTPTCDYVAFELTLLKMVAWKWSKVDTQDLEDDEHDIVTVLLALVIIKSSLRFLS